MGLTPKDVENITVNWKLVVETVGLQEAGNLLFQRLFEIAPELKKKFKLFEQTYDEKEKREQLQKHAMTVMTTIDVAIGKLKEQKLDELSEVLLDVGIAHHIHHISDEDFAPVGEALIWTLAKGLGDRFTGDVKSSYLQLYGVVKTCMLPGVEKGLDGVPVPIS